jgi:hypothetical protein
VKAIVVGVAAVMLMAGVQAAQDQSQDERIHFAIVQSKYKVTTKTAVYWQFSWTVEIKNNSPSPVTLAASIDFRDRDGYSVATDLSSPKPIANGATGVFSGARLIAADQAVNVVEAHAEVKRVSTTTK